MNSIISLLQLTVYTLTTISSALLVILTAMLIYGLVYFFKNYLKKKLPRPGLVGLSVLSQGESGMLKFVLTMPEKGASDVVSRELTVSVDGAEPVVFTLTGDVVESQEFEAADGAAVTGTLVDVDDAGNKSEAREFTFVLVDTIAPPQPGEVGVKVVSES